MHVHPAPVLRIMWALCTICFSLSLRIGEALHPGPPCHSLDEPEADLFSDHGSAFSGHEVLHPFDNPFLDEQMDGSSSTQDTFSSHVSQPDCIIPSVADWKLSDEQLVNWREIENAFKLQVTWKGKPSGLLKSPSKSQAHVPGILHGNFTQSRTFNGARPGFVFKTGSSGTGYYKDFAATPSEKPRPDVLLLADCVPMPPSTYNYSSCSGPVSYMHTLRTHKRARQNRDNMGNRKRPIKRHSRSCPIPPLTSKEAIRDCLLGDSWWKKAGLWAVDTYNGNCWATTKNSIFPRSAADVACIQETKISGCQAEAIIATQASAIKWACVASPALGSSGGCAVSCRAGIGLSPHPDSLVADGFQHRIKFAHCSAVLRGGFHCGSIYPKDSEGISEGNLLLLLEIAIALRSIKGPWIIGGDWNLSPDLLRSTRWLELVGGQIFAPDNPTCHSSVYDYFVVANSFAHAVCGVFRISDAGLHPHWPSRLLLRGNTRRLLVRTQVKPFKISGTLPEGPVLQNEGFDSIAREKFEHACEHPPCTHDILEKDMRDWFAHARTEWMSLAGLKAEQPISLATKFKFVPAVGPPAKAVAGMSNFSICWRVAARNLTEVARILDGSWAPNLKDRSTKAACVINKHLATLENTSQHAPPGFFKNSYSSWRFAVRHAIWNSYPDTIHKLCSIADAKAKSLELCTRRENLSKWRNALSDTRIPGCKLPSRLAYRWIKGPAGFSISPICSLEESQNLVDEFGIPSDQYPSSNALKVPDPIVSCTSVPLQSQVEVEAEASKWAELWECDGGHQPYPILQLNAPPAPLIGEFILRAALSFPAHTGLGADNASPRAFARLSVAALHALARLFMLLEAVGTWPSILRLVFIVLLPKPDGGRRPIGLFNSVMRIWMRTRSSLARQWEAMHARPCLYGGTNMGAQRAAWNVAY